MSGSEPGPGSGSGIGPGVGRGDGVRKDSISSLHFLPISLVCFQAAFSSAPVTAELDLSSPSLARSPFFSFPVESLVAAFDFDSVSLRIVPGFSFLSALSFWLSGAADF